MWRVHEAAGLGKIVKLYSQCHASGGHSVCYQAHLAAAIVRDLDVILAN